MKQTDETVGPREGHPSQRYFVEEQAKFFRCSGLAAAPPIPAEKQLAIPAALLSAEMGEAGEKERRGRPPKTDRNAVKSERIMLRFTPPEMKRILENAAAAGTTPASYMEGIVHRGFVLPKEEAAEIAGELRGCRTAVNRFGVNLNQYARAANAGKVWQRYDEVMACSLAFLRLLDEVRNRLLYKLKRQK